MAGMRAVGWVLGDAVVQHGDGDWVEQAAEAYVDAHGDDAQVGTAAAQLCLVLAGYRRGAPACHCLDAPVQQRVVVEDLRGERPKVSFWKRSALICTELQTVDFAQSS